MRRFQSWLGPDMEAFIAFQKASERWNRTYEQNLCIFDRYCASSFPEMDLLTQDMVDGWCAQRSTETNNSCRTRVVVILNFVRYLRDREITDIVGPHIPKMEPRTYVPHAFTGLEMENFFRVCDSLPRTHATRTRRMVVPVFFRLRYSTRIRTNEARLQVATWASPRAFSTSAIPKALLSTMWFSMTPCGTCYRGIMPRFKR